MSSAASPYHTQPVSFIKKRLSMSLVVRRFTCLLWRIYERVSFRRSMFPSQHFSVSLLFVVNVVMTVMVNAANTWCPHKTENAASRLFSSQTLSEICVATACPGCICCAIKRKKRHNMPKALNKWIDFIRRRTIRLTYLNLTYPAWLIFDWQHRWTAGCANKVLKHFRLIMKTW